MANVDVAVGERRPIVQKERPACRFAFERLLIDTVALPEFQNLRLALGEVGALRDRKLIAVHPVRVLDVGLGNVQSLAVVGFHIFGLRGRRRRRFGVNVSHKWVLSIKGK